MKSNGNFSLTLALGSLLTICFNAGLANAQIQKNASGKFTMPFEARWGLATLPAGDYTFTLEGTGIGATVRVYRGPECVAMIQNASYDRASSGPAALTMIHNRDGNAVSDLRLPGIGQVFHYASHNASSGAAKQELARVVPVKTTGR
jgi:hypothetical protein